MTVTLYCKEPAGLKLGPSATPGEFIEFKNSWATFEEKDFPDWEKWVNHPGTPPIEVLPEDSDEVPPSADAVECPECGRAFAHKGALTGHLRSHAPKE